MVWFHPLVAVVFEVAFVMDMKFSNGPGRLWPSSLTVVVAIGGIYFLTPVLRELPVNVAYPIWTVIGSLGTVSLGVLLFGESPTAVKLVFVGLIVTGVVGLKQAMRYLTYNRPRFRPFESSRADHPGGVQLPHPARPDDAVAVPEPDHRH